MLVGTRPPPRYFMAEASMPSAVPRTPPYTPRFMGPKPQRRPVRADSPASPTPVLPTETVSPAKKPAFSKARSDTLQIQELAEGDVGYNTDANVVLPAELEEARSNSDNDEDEDDDDLDDAAGNDNNHKNDRIKEETIALTSDSEGSDTGISHRFSRMGYMDGDNEAEFHNVRREHHLRRRRTLSRAYKRSHSQSVTRDAESSDLDPDCMADHDHERSARRLRRRVRGPVVEERSPLRTASISPSPVPFGHLAFFAIPSRPTSVASHRLGESRVVPGGSARSVQIDDEDDDHHDDDDDDDDDDESDEEDDSDDDMDVDDG